MSPQHEGEAASLPTSRHTHAGYAGIPATPAPTCPFLSEGTPPAVAFLQPGGVTGGRRGMRGQAAVNRGDKRQGVRK